MSYEIWPCLEGDRGQFETENNKKQRNSLIFQRFHIYYSLTNV